MTVIVTPQRLTQTPISELLYGNFIELGCGLQVEGMWSEMLFNRSFEPFTPYRDAHNYWFDLLYDENDPSKGYKTDWTGECWYHSGYEHNAWFAAPGEEGPFHIDANSTFFIAKSPVLDVEIELVRAGARHGETALRLTNRETERWGAVAQEGKFLRKGETYRFRGWMQSEGAPTRAEVRFYSEGSWDAPIVALPLGEIGSEPTEKTVSFCNEAFEGRATFSLWIAPQSAVILDDFSLMPASAVYGWRREVIAASRRVRPTVIRWPGGCFASFYDWRDGIGPSSQRKPRPSYFWGGMNVNDVGTAELALFTKELGAESMICVNVHHPLKQKYDHYADAQENNLHGRDFPEFADIRQGAQDAADWVAYCNAPVTHPMGALRAEHGYPEPFGVKLWEMDNETGRWFQPEEYARAVVVYSRAMKAADPTIQIGMVTYSSGFIENLEKMLAIAGRDIDFLADRRTGEQKTDGILARMRAFNAENGTNIRYCHTEWMPYTFEPDAFSEMPGVTRSFVFSTWRTALNVLRCLMMWQRKGSDVMFVNFNNFANTHNGCVMDTAKEGVTLSASGKAMELLSHSPAAWPLVLEDYESDERAEFQVQAAWDRDARRLVLYALNMEAETREVTFTLSALGRNFKTAEISVLRAESLSAANTLSNPDAVRREDRIERNLNIKESYPIAVPNYAFVQAVLE